jgi:hypothetical protein
MACIDIGMTEESAIRSTWVGRWLRRWLGIAPRELEFEARGFRGGTAKARDRVEQIAATFARGYHTALASTSFETLTASLGAVAVELRGFAYEGAGMGLTVLDWLTPWRRDRGVRWLLGPADAHAYMVHVGVGWAMARLPMRVERTLTRFDALLRWLVIDGVGFHEGFFRSEKRLRGETSPAWLRGYQRRAFDQGFGRCLVFVEGGEVESIAAAIGRLDPGRHEDLWSGVGLACAYAGLVEEVAGLRWLRGVAGSHGAALAQGAAFAAKARARAGHIPWHTDSVCREFCGISAEEAAAATDAARPAPPWDFEGCSYETWRRQTRALILKRSSGPS